MKKKMLVVVDYQNDFVNGALGFEGAEKLDSGIAAKVREFCENGDIVVYTLDTHDARYLNTREGKALPIPHCIQDTDGWGLYGETHDVLKAAIAAGGNIICLQKQTFGVSPIEMTELLPNVSLDTIEIVGLVTNMCVMANACGFQAMYPEAQIIVHAYLCDSFNRELHDKTLDVLRGMQITVLRARRVRDELCAGCTSESCAHCPDDGGERCPACPCEACKTDEATGKRDNYQLRMPT